MPAVTMRAQAVCMWSVERAAKKNKGMLDWQTGWCRCALNSDCFQL